MKRLIISLCLLVVAGRAFADNYITFGENDTLRVPTSCLGDQMTVPMHMNFTGYVDYWSVSFVMEQGALSVVAAQPSPSMTVDYLRSNGTPATYHAILYNTSDWLTFTSSIPENVLGYWDPDNDGIYECYWNVKWESGYYENMFEFTLDIPADFTDETVTLNGIWTSHRDWRGPTTNGMGSSVVHVIVEYLRGDVNGDGAVSITDVTVLIDYLLSGDLTGIDLNAADCNLDSSVTIADVTSLIDNLLNGSW